MEMNKIKFITYENRVNPHITIHKIGCKQIKKNGGEGRGEYNEFRTYTDADNYANTTNLPKRNCSFCKPQNYL